MTPVRPESDGVDAAAWLRRALLTDMQLLGLAPIRHWPGFGKDFDPVTNRAVCRLCKKQVDRDEWASGVCKGQP